MIQKTSLESQITDCWDNRVLRGDGVGVGWGWDLALISMTKGTIVNG